MNMAVFFWSLLLLAIILGVAGTLRGWRAAQIVASACSFVFCIAAAASIGVLMLPLPLIHLWLAISKHPAPLLVRICAGAIDLAFFPALTLVLALPLIRARKFRNLPFLALLTAFFLADLFFQLGTNGVLNAGQHIGLSIAVDIIAVLIVIVGGRIIPAFTKSGLARQGIAVELRSDSWIEISAVASIVVMLAADLVIPPLTGAVAFLAAAAQAIRLTQWQDHRAVRDPLIWALHLGYAWLVVGLLLKGMWFLAAMPLAEKWIHALTVGAFASMILAVMTRASLGHTGRALTAPGSIATAYGLVTAAAAVRVFAPAVFPAEYNAIVAAAGLLWIAAFAIFLWVYTPILLRPRPDGRPG